jgi:hypothetical protein
MKLRLLSLLLAFPLLASSPAFALFNAQVLTGKRDTKFESNNQSPSKSGDELKLAAHLDPIPLVPIGFGLSLSQTTWDAFDTYTGVDGYEIGLEVEAWLPLELMGLVPYAKLGYTVAGQYGLKGKVAGQEFTRVYKPSGLYLAAGLKWEFLLRLGVMLEVEQSTRTLAFEKLEDLPLDQVITSTDVDAKSMSILFGVQAGL